MAVQFKGGGPADTAVIAGEVGVTFGNISQEIGFVKAGRMRALAVTSAKRNPAMPELPTVAEAAPEGPLRGYEFDTWFVVAAPKGTPRAIVDTLNSHIRKALTAPDQVKFYEERGLTVIASTPEEAAAHLERSRRSGRASSRSAASRRSEMLDRLIERHGLALVFANVLLEQVGLPIPAVPTLIVCGALAAEGRISAAAVLGLAFLACAIGDGLWFLAGRLYGRRVLRFLCGISLSPDSCVRQTQTQFERWGGIALVAAKFIPGLSTVAPPLAGAMRYGWVAVHAPEFAGHPRLGRRRDRRRHAFPRAGQRAARPARRPGKSRRRLDRGGPVRLCRLQMAGKAAPV